MKTADYTLALFKDGAPVTLDDLTAMEAEGFVSIAEGVANYLRSKHPIGDEALGCSVHDGGVRVADFRVVGRPRDEFAVRASFTPDTPDRSPAGAAHLSP